MDKVWKGGGREPYNLYIFFLDLMIGFIIIGVAITFLLLGGCDTSYSDCHNDCLGVCLHGSSYFNPNFSITPLGINCSEKCNLRCAGGTT
jgi:hypothetical protein